MKDLFFAQNPRLISKCVYQLLLGRVLNNRIERGFDGCLFSVTVCFYSLIKVIRQKLS